MREKKFRIAVFVFLAAAILAGGCSMRHATRAEGVAQALTQMKETARRHVPDQERLDALLESIDGLQAELDAFDGALDRATSQLQVLNADPATTRADMETALDRFEVERNAARSRVIQRHFQIVALTEAKEWSALSGYEHKAMLAAGHQ